MSQKLLSAKETESHAGRHFSRVQSICNCCSGCLVITAKQFPHFSSYLINFWRHRRELSGEIFSEFPITSCTTFLHQKILPWKKLFAVTEYLSNFCRTIYNSNYVSSIKDIRGYLVTNFYMILYCCSIQQNVPITQTK